MMLMNDFCRGAWEAINYTVHILEEEDLETVKAKLGEMKGSLERCQAKTFEPMIKGS